MKTLTVDLTLTDLYVKHFDGGSTFQQVRDTLEVIEVLTDAFNYTHQSSYFLGSERNRRNVSTLQTSFQFFTNSLISNLLEAAESSEQFDWESFELHDSISDLAPDLDWYLEFSGTTIAVFDCFFNHDSMQGENPEEFIELSLMIRDFFISLLGSALKQNLAADASTSIIYPNCTEPSPDAESVYQ